MTNMTAREASSHFNHADRATTRLLPPNVPVDVNVVAPEPPKIFYGVIHELDAQSGYRAILARLTRVSEALQRAMFIA
jgi:hypothetical protein